LLDDVSILDGVVRVWAHVRSLPVGLPIRDHWVSHLAGSVRGLSCRR
jgi:hypothetical protein